MTIIQTNKINKSILTGFFLAASWCCYADAITYEYDSLNRLTRVVYDETTSIEYTYDAAGNRLRKLVIQPPNPDTDLSGTVDFIDYARLAEDWLKPVDHRKGDLDLNRDGIVDIYDLAIMADYWLDPGEPL